MPGILPMKVIKVGTNAQTRIAQACDRCRSKKIRCDGIRPSCTQCVNVGFECKTSDKLSRRAFPRGYTESLEERVRQLESEVRDLKLLLDEKDEKIDVLSRIHSHSPQPQPRKKNMPPPVATPPELDASKEDKDDSFKIVQAPSLVEEEEEEPYFVGTSSSRMLIDAFKAKLREQGKPAAEFSTRALFSQMPRSLSTDAKQQPVCWQAPARMVSDQLVNIFFQEWAPLFPVLHRPTFLALYEDYVSAPETLDDKKKLAQLNLVFAVAAQSSETSFQQDIKSFNTQWQAALDHFLMDNSLSTLQCLLLAQIACLQSGDYPRLSKFRGLAVSLSQHLGLHQSQKRFTLGTLTGETRKRLFWTLYVLDCFTAAQLGVPRLLREEDIHCEYPVDADDEYITEKGFLPTLPGEFTKVSSALALFKAARILSKVLTENYPASVSHEISFRKLLALSDDLDDWLKSLPQHLRLNFVQEKPSTNMISSRSPLLSLAYHYIRSLIYRPAVCSSTDIGVMAGSAKVSLATSSKHIVQIVQLLTERNLSFSFCLNRNELLIACGFGLVFQNLDLEVGSGLMKENQRLSFIIANILERQPSRTAVEYRRVTTALALQHMSSEQRRAPALSRHNSDSDISGSQDGMGSAQKHIRAIMSRFSSSSKTFRPDERRATLPVINMAGPNTSQTSLSSIRSEPHVARSEPPLSPYLQNSSLSPPKIVKRPNSALTKPSASSTNLDYLPIGSTGLRGASYTATQSKSGASPQDWERLLSSLDNGQTNIYDGIYGGPPIDALIDVPPATDSTLVWSPDVWAVGNDLSAPPPQSVLSFSDESLTSGGDEFPELANVESSNSGFGGLIMPEMTASEVEGWMDGGFGL